MNQKAPAAITTTDPANTSRRRAHSLRDRKTANANATVTTTSNCPISTPKLNENKDQPRARLGNSISRRTFAKPNPWMKPNANAIHALTSRPPCARRLSAPTYTMLSAIAGSMMRADGVRTFKAANESVMLCAIVNEVTTIQPPYRAAEQQQADKEQKV